MDRTTLEEHLRRGLSLAEIGRLVGRHESTLWYWVGRYGLRAVNRERHAARGPLPRAELEDRVGRGWSIREIAAAVDGSPTSVRHWLREYGLRTKSAEQRHAYAGTAARALLTCARHDDTGFSRRNGGGWRCLKCRTEEVTRRRQRVKRALVEDAGGSCRACGYDRCIAALHLHHVDAGDKRFSLSHRGVARSLAKARCEAAKCSLLCGNGHAEVEAGVRSIDEILIS